MTAVLVACGSTPSPSPVPVAPAVTAVPGPPPITGRERLGWAQSAAADELAGLGFVIYLDGVRSIPTDVSCTASSGGVGFECSAPLPAMSNGSHTLELAAFLKKDTSVESERSAALNVTVAALAPGADSGSPLRDRQLRDARPSGPRQNGRQPGNGRR